jgi:hypothetical protein
LSFVVFIGQNNLISFSQRVARWKKKTQLKLYNSHTKVNFTDTLDSLHASQLALQTQISSFLDQEVFLHFKIKKKDQTLIIWKLTKDTQSYGYAVKSLTG